MDPKKIFPEPLRRILSLLKDARIGSYGAQAAFFVLLSAMPFLVFLSAILHYVPWSSADLIRFLPDSLRSAAELLPGETPSAALLSFSAVTALWSASRGIVALTRGLNRMYGNDETRNYLTLRLFALAETLVLEIVLLCTLGFAVQGEALGLAGKGWERPLGAVAGFLILTGFFLFLYTVLPDHSLRPLSQLPGAAGAAAGWMIFTKGFSFYVRFLADFPRLYGALSNMAMLMLWLWLCLCILFLGALLNRWIAENTEK